MFDRIVIIGCGLIGSSIAGALKSRGNVKELVGVETKDLASAKSTGYYNIILQSFDEIDSADLVVVCTPVSCTEEIFTEIIKKNDHSNFKLITDVVSVKKRLLDFVDHLETGLKEKFLSNFLSSHPLAGSEKIGAKHSNPLIFHNSNVLICPFEDNNSMSEEKVLTTRVKKWQQKFLEDFWVSLGSTPKTFPIRQHDLFFAGISHFPHLISYCLTLVLSRSTYSKESLHTYGGGLRDTTRIAGASPELWMDIILDNKEEIIKLLGQWTACWEEITTSIHNSDKERLKQLLGEASSWRNKLEKNNTK